MLAPRIVERRTVNDTMMRRRAPAHVVATPQQKGGTGTTGTTGTKETTETTETIETIPVVTTEVSTEEDTAETGLSKIAVTETVMKNMVPAGERTEVMAPTKDHLFVVSPE